MTDEVITTGLMPYRKAFANDHLGEQVAETVVHGTGPRLKRSNKNV